MSMNDSELAEMTARIWDWVLGFKLEPAGPGPAAADGTDRVIATLAFTGAWAGALSLRCPLGLARAAAAVIYETDAQSATATQAAETIGELTNITGGNLKPALPHPVDLGLPIVTFGDHLNQILPGEELVKQVYLACQGHTLEVRLTRSRPVSGAIARAGAARRGRMNGRE